MSALVTGRDPLNPADRDPREVCALMSPRVCSKFDKILRRNAHRGRKNQA